MHIIIYYSNTMFNLNAYILFSLDRLKINDLLSSELYSKKMYS